MRAIPAAQIAELREQHRDTPLLDLFRVQFEVDATWSPIFCAVATTEIVQHGGEDYHPFPVLRGAIQTDQDANLPRMTLQIGNHTRELLSLFDAAGGFDGAHVRHTLVLHSAPDVALIVTEWVVRGVEATDDRIALSMESAVGRLKRKVPPERYHHDRCPFVYGSALCGATKTGPADSCGKRLIDCRGKQNEVRYGGFPAMHI